MIGKGFKCCRCPEKVSYLLKMPLNTSWLKQGKAGLWVEVTSRASAVGRRCGVEVSVRVGQQNLPVGRIGFQIWVFGLGSGPSFCGQEVLGVATDRRNQSATEHQIVTSTYTV